MTQNTIGTDGSEDDAAFVERMDKLKAALTAARLGTDASLPRDGLREGMLRAAEIAKETGDRVRHPIPGGDEAASAYEAATAIRAEADAIPADAGGVTEAEVELVAEAIWRARVQFHGDNFESERLLLIEQDPIIRDSTYAEARAALAARSPVR